MKKEQAKVDAKAKADADPTAPKAPSDATDP